MKKLFSFSFSLVIGILLLGYTCTKFECEQLSGFLQKTDNARTNYNITNPEPFEVVQSNITVEGMASVRSGFVQYRVKDASNQLLAVGQIYIPQTLFGEMRSFSGEIELEKDASTAEGMLELFEKSNLDGSTVNGILIPIQFAE